MNDLNAVRAFFLADRMKYLVQLKYLYLYGDALEMYTTQGGGQGILLSYLPTVAHWDALSYSHTDRIHLAAATDSTAAAQLIRHIQDCYPHDQKRIFKFCDEWLRQQFAQSFAMTHVLTVISFTTPTGTHFTPDASVKIAHLPDAATQQLYLANDYTQAELQQYFDNGALSFTLFEDRIPVCTCMAFQNFDDVWEIGALRTVESAQRKGYARRVVQTALSELLKRGLVPRYQSKATNHASIQLARSLGLVECLNFQHYSAVR